MPYFKAIINLKLPKKDGLVEETQKMCREASPLIIKDLEHTTSGWKGEKPKWSSQVKTTKHVVTLRVGLKDEKSTGGKKYTYVSKGTKPHLILPKKARALVFLPKNAQQLVFTKRVRHPGTKAQKLEEPVMEKWNKELNQRFEKAIKKSLETVTGENYG